MAAAQAVVGELRAGTADKDSLIDVCARQALLSFWADLKPENARIPACLIQGDTPGKDAR